MNKKHWKIKWKHSRDKKKKVFDKKKEPEMQN